MTGIEINGEYLDLPPTVLLEIVRNSPYLNNDEIDGEYSLPIAVPYTNRNFRLLGYTGNHYKQHSKQSIDAKLHGSAGIVYPGTLLLDGFERNLNQPESILCNTLFVFSISDFYQQVKDKKLSDFAYGGPRTFNWTSNNPVDGSSGFWQHIHTIRDGSADYVFVPIQNESYGHLPVILNPSYASVKWMNKLDAFFTTTNYYKDIENAVSLCPGIRLSYILKKIFEEIGFQLTGEVLSDATFNKIFIQSFRGIYWCDYKANVPGNYTPLSSITININEHVPPNYSVQDFIIDIKNRYGLAFVFDSNRRLCTLKYLKTRLTSGSQKDFTRYTTAAVKAKFEEKTRVISLKNTIDGRDSYPVVLTTTGVPLISAVLKIENLPAASGIQEGTYCYVHTENSYYQVVGDSGGSSRHWEKGFDNIGDYIATGETEAITTRMSPFAVSRIEYRDYGVIHKYIGHFLTCDQPGNWYQNPDLNAWGLRTFFYHGMQYDIRDDGSTTDRARYPYGVPYSTDNYGNELGGWSDVYVRQYGTVNNGLVEMFWKEWLKVYNSTDLRTIVLRLPLYELYNLNWEDFIMIQNVLFMIKKMKFNIPYTNTVEFEMLKIS